MEKYAPPHEKIRPDEVSRSGSASGSRAPLEPVLICTATKERKQIPATWAAVTAVLAASDQNLNRTSNLHLTR
jgi:hypothetical protein